MRLLQGVALDIPHTLGLAVQAVDWLSEHADTIAQESASIDSGVFARSCAHECLIFVRVRCFPRAHFWNHVLGARLVGCRSRAASMEKSGAGHDQPSAQPAQLFRIPAGPVGRHGGERVLHRWVLAG